MGSLFAIFFTEIVAFIVRLQLSNVTWQCGMFRTGTAGNGEALDQQMLVQKLGRYIVVTKLFLFVISLFTIWGHGKSISGRPADAFQDWDKSIANLSIEASFDVTPNITEVSWSILYFKRGFSRVTFYSPWNSLRHITCNPMQRQQQSCGRYLYIGCFDCLPGYPICTLRNFIVVSTCLDSFSMFDGVLLFYPYNPTTFLRFQVSDLRSQPDALAFALKLSLSGGPGQAMDPGNLRLILS